MIPAWRATWAGEGGGVLVNQAPHQLDLLQWLCGMPSLMEAHLKYGSHCNITVEDDVTAYFEYPNGATGTFINVLMMHWEQTVWRSMEITERSLLQTVSPLLLRKWISQKMYGIMNWISDRCWHW